MIIFIPLGGIGQRFKDNGYTKPKALINVFGKPILYYLLDSLNIKEELVYISYNIEYKYFRFEDMLKKSYPNINFKFFCLEKNTRGAAETIKISLSQLNNNDCPILSLDGDNFYDIDIINLWDGRDIIFTVEDFNKNPIYSYIKKDLYVSEIIEKEKISNNACTGAYGFSSYKQLLKYSTLLIENNSLQKGEFYTSGVINLMVKNGILFDSFNLSNSNWKCLGTPIQVRTFCNNYPMFSCKDWTLKIKNKRICFDLDNTLVTYPKINGDYRTVEPIQKNINLLRYIKKLGNTIIIYTARRMKTHDGSTGKVLADIGSITFETLKKYNIPFDEIYFGKPYADFYIDDLAINCYNNIEKKLGYYMDKIEPRSFNLLETNSIETLKKKSDNLSGEIFYYKNIPPDIKDIFPLFIDYDKNNKWYVIEKINGLTASTLYTSELLTTTNLISIMSTINRIHNSNIILNTSDDIYSNYLKKLEKRYTNYDYSPFENSESVYNYLKTELEKYQNKKLGKQSIIHGDTVFTNIIINEYEKIKLIDMRGDLNGKLTLYGDWLYDWGKLYQSLIGYDKILLNKKISTIYEIEMLSCFKRYFLNKFSVDDFKNLKLITKSLLFTLIPLHDNDKCISYYKLIFSKHLE
tara:strand:- start:1164 stop:3068 length:1905 start_codon:yes stop_codon:yes gene_type:complete